MRRILLFLLSSIVSASNICGFKDKGNSRDRVFNASMKDQSVETIFNNYVDNQEEVFLHNYATTYFSNLKSRFGINSHETCSFVAAGMLLSFFDSYWNDDFIDHSFEEDAIYSQSYNQDSNLDYPPFDIESPGITSEILEDVEQLNLNEYQAYVVANQNNYLQSYLIKLAYDMYDDYLFDNPSNPYGMNLYQQTHLLSYYLIYKRSITSSRAIVYSLNNNNSDLEEEIIDLVSDGIPVIINAVSSIFGGHCMVAYDYDAVSNDIYVHTGWKNNEGKALTHVSLKQLGITENDLDSIVVIETTYDHEYESEHYWNSMTGEYRCACSFIYPRNLHRIGGNYLDLIPTFIWDSLYEEKWFEDYYPYIKFSVLNENGVLMFCTNQYNNTSRVFTNNEWSLLTNNYLYDTYQVKLELFFGSNTIPEYTVVEQFEVPHLANYHTIVPTDYSFEDAYPTDSYTRDTFVTSTTNSNYSFQTRRYRTGYIHNECIVMSCKRINVNDAFIEYQFLHGVDRIDVELSHWREVTTEGLTSITGFARADIIKQSQYIRQINLLSSTTNLSQNRNNMTLFTLTFDNPISRIRFSCRTFGTNYNDNNRGRICIGEMKVYETNNNVLPLNGYELAYEPEEWTNFQSICRCYNYALDYIDNRCINVGESTGHTSLDIPNYYSDSTLKCLFAYDSKHLSRYYDLIFGFPYRGEVEKYQACPDGTYKVALFYDSILLDYHWYRQNSDGTWSHKPGRSDVMNVDSDGYTIYDPCVCEREHGGYTYDTFVGFFAVGPFRDSKPNEHWAEVIYDD